MPEYNLWLLNEPWISCHKIHTINKIPRNKRRQHRTCSIYKEKNLTGPLTVCNASFVHKLACFVLMNNWTMNVHGDFCAKQNSNGAMEIEEVDMFRCYFVPCL